MPNQNQPNKQSDKANPKDGKNPQEKFKNNPADEKQNRQNQSGDRSSHRE